MLTTFEPVDEDSKIIKGQDTKGADRAAEVLQKPTTTVLQPCLLPSIGSEL